MLTILLLTLGMSQVENNQQELQRLLEESMSTGEDDLRNAPPIPMWPPGLPNALKLQKGSQVDSDGTFYPYPLDFVVNFHLAAWEQYPFQCQTRLSLAQETKEQMYEVLMGQLEEQSTPPKPLTNTTTLLIYLGVGFVFGSVTTIAIAASVSP